MFCWYFINVVIQAKIQVFFQSYEKHTSNHIWYEDMHTYGQFPLSATHEWTEWIWFYFHLKAIFEDMRFNAIRWRFPFYRCLRHPSNHTLSVYTWRLGRRAVVDTLTRRQMRLSWGRSATVWFVMIPSTVCNSVILITITGVLTSSILIVTICGSWKMTPRTDFPTLRLVTWKGVYPPVMSFWRRIFRGQWVANVITLSTSITIASNILSALWMNIPGDDICISNYIHIGNVIFLLLLRIVMMMTIFMIKRLVLGRMWMVFMKASIIMLRITTSRSG